VPQNRKSKSLSEVLIVPTAVNESQFQKPVLQAKAFLRQAIWEATLMMMMMMMMILEVVIMMTI
jgi:hypothetical protein